MRRLFNLWPSRRRRMERDLARELRDHLDRRIVELKQSDARLTDAEARRRAALEFGGVAQVSEDVSETWRWRWIDNLSRDLRYALPRADAQSGLRPHRPSLARARHRRQRRAVLADRSGAAAAAARQRAGASRPSGVERHVPEQPVQLRQSPVVSAVPRLRRAARCLRWRVLPSSEVRQLLDGTRRRAASARARRDRVRLVFSRARRATGSGTADRSIRRSPSQRASRRRDLLSILAARLRRRFRRGGTHGAGEQPADDGDWHRAGERSPASIRCPCRRCGFRR